MIKSSSAFIMCLVLLIVLLAIAGIAFLTGCTEVMMFASITIVVFGIILPNCDKEN